MAGAPAGRRRNVDTARKRLQYKLQKFIYVQYILWMVRFADSLYRHAARAPGRAAERHDRNFAMLLIDILSRHEGGLTQTERRLIDVLLADPTGAAMFSATELAEKAGTHPSSLVRLAKKLGFDGFPDLRARLRDEIVLPDQPAARLRRRLDGLPREAVLESVVERERANLAALPHHVSDEQIKRAATLLSRSRRVLLFGEGGARMLRDLMSDRLRRIGILAEVMPAEAREVAASLTALTADDMLLAFAFARLPRLLPAVLAEAARCGATSVVLSDLAGSLLRPTPDLLIAAPRGPGGQSQALVVPLVLCHAILLTIAMVDKGRSLKRAERYGKLRAALTEQSR